MWAGRRMVHRVAPAAMAPRHSGFRMSSGATTPKREVGVAVVGGSGYTGAELIRLLAAHPFAKVRAHGSGRGALYVVVDCA